MFRNNAARLILGICKREHISPHLELNAIRGWLEENKLSIHLGKTESILITSKIRLARTDILKISCGSVSIESKSKITYLGLTFDNDMSFSSMGNSVIKKVNAKLKSLYRKSAFFGTNERKLLCSALVKPHFEYACNDDQNEREIRMYVVP